ncbi:glycoside hydrolase family 95 protein [Lacticaseibacillus suihuaensis]
MKLMEQTPATRFEDAHLLGNGSLGATVYGDPVHDDVLINHDTLWSGEEHDTFNPETRAHFEEARRLTLAGQFRAANDLINDHMVGCWSAAYLPLAHVHLTLGNTSNWRDAEQKRRLAGERPVTDYRRELDLDSAVATVSFEQAGQPFTRTYWVSHPDNVVGIRYQSPAPFDLSVALDSPLRHEGRHLSVGTVAVTGRAPDQVESYWPQYSPRMVYEADSHALRFCAVATVADTDGTLTQDAVRTYVHGATYVEVLVSATTNYAGFQQPRDLAVQPLVEAAQAVVAQAATHDWAALTARHVADYRQLADRFGLRVAGPSTDIWPTSKRLAAFATMDDPSLSALVMQYARYLMIASSRPGSQAMNLQGIWNANPCPMWASNYTTNINVQMCYWIAENLNLAECHEPLMAMLQELAVTGHRAALHLIDSDGWMVWHNTDLWRMADVAGEDASWAWWPTAGLWLTQHIWTHYTYSQDRAFLAKMMPVLTGAMQFVCDFVVWDDALGAYVTAPSLSPENKFVLPGHTVRDNAEDLEQIRQTSRFSPDHPALAAVSKISTMDLSLIRELIADYQAACRVLGQAELPAVATVAAHLPAFQIGRYGQLQEWEQDFAECTPGMGHVSHLVGAYPGNVLTADPKLMAAAKAALDRRQRNGAATGQWPSAWNLCLNARFKDLTACYLNEASLHAGLGANFFTAETLQIDAVMGWAAGLAEMLLQGHRGVDELLPVLLPSWRDGDCHGLRSPAGIDYALVWRNGELTQATLVATRDVTRTVVYQGATLEVTLAPGEHKTLAYDAATKTLQEVADA